MKSRSARCWKSVWKKGKKTGKKMCLRESGIAHMLSGLSPGTPHPYLAGADDILVAGVHRQCAERISGEKGCDETDIRVSGCGLGFDSRRG